MNHLWNPPGDTFYKCCGDENDGNDDDENDGNDDDADKMIKMMAKISHPLPESHTAGCRSRGEDLCCLSRSVPAKPTSPPGLDFLEIVVCIS